MLAMKATVVPELEARHRIILAPAAPAPGGTDDVDIVCGACGTILMRRADPFLALHNVLIRCPKCKHYNDSGL